MSMPLLLLVAVIKNMLKVQWIAIANMDIPAIFAYGGYDCTRVILTVRISTWFLFSKVSVKWNHGDMTAEEVKILNVMPALAWWLWWYVYC